MITQEFDDRTMANMEVALEQACHHFPAKLDQHEARKFIASSILQCVQSGDRTLRGMTRAGYRAASQILDKKLDAEASA
jgi:hypothetical protein